MVSSAVGEVDCESLVEVECLVDGCCEYEGKKRIVVLTANTVVKKLAVVIELETAAIAYRTVFGGEGDATTAVLAVFLGEFV